MEIIQSAVERIVFEMENFMPQSYWDRIVMTKTVPDAQRELLQSRLIEHFQSTLNLPYLSEQDQRLIVHATVAIVSDAMGNTKLDDILAQDATSVSLAAIFIREAMGIDDMEALRNEVSSIIELPIPLPEPAVKWVIGKGVAALVAILNDAVDLSLVECFGKARTRPVTSAADFEEVLRLNVTELLDHNMNVFGMPAFVEAFVLAKIVDSYFDLCVTKSRIDTAVAMLLKPIAALGALIKAAVDIPGMSDDDETEIIQSAVEKIVADVESFMPRAYWERIVTSKAVPDAQRELLQSRLLVYYGDKLPYLPYLSEDDERLILHATIAILTDAMGNTKLDDILSQETTSLSLIAIYIR
ncbi:hypothetical protein DYB28_012709 [Aphanomyces astaci]|uniref:Uncharacterized protein n=1 Tax=Aphanomyces astaci TaxID=112090 RepID=A0A9X8DR13_APHAT|nr:hypothetical protein DYB28_012709 [Aphanomyces astaci]